MIIIRVRFVHCTVSVRAALFQVYFSDIFEVALHLQISIRNGPECKGKKDFTEVRCKTIPDYQFAFHATNLKIERFISKILFFSQGRGRKSLKTMLFYPKVSPLCKMVYAHLAQVSKFRAFHTQNPEKLSEPFLRTRV